MGVDGASCFEPYGSRRSAISNDYSYSGLLVWLSQW